VSVEGTTITVDGRHTVELSRKPSATASAPTLDALLAGLPESTTVGADALSGYVAVVVPLPHTQVVAWQVGEAATPVTDAPEPEQVAAGWIRHSEEGAQLVLPDAEAALFARARHALAMGVAVDASVIELAEAVSANVRSGWFDAALDGTDRLAAAQRGRGRIGEGRAVNDRCAGGVRLVAPGRRPGRRARAPGRPGGGRGPVAAAPRRQAART